jgi:hypothetical protein
MLPQPGYQLDSPFIQTLKQFPADISPAPEHFPFHFAAQKVNNIPIPVIRIAGSKAKRAYLPTVIDNRM